MFEIKNILKSYFIKWFKKDEIKKDPIVPNPISSPKVDVKPDWQMKLSVKKGNIGEQIVQGYLEKRGHVVYKCITKGAHAFDLMAIKDKKIIRIAEVKSKARMKNKETGINLSNYKEYIAILEKYNLDTFIFFVDDIEERIYGNYISAIKNPVSIDNVKYPYTKRLKKDGVQVTFFHTAVMKQIVKLSKEEVEELKKHTTRNSNYDYK